MNYSWIDKTKHLSGNINDILPSLESASIHVRYSKKHFEVWYLTEYLLSAVKVRLKSLNITPSELRLKLRSNYGKSL